jgi:hypothetical protein
MRGHLQSLLVLVREYTNKAKRGYCQEVGGHPTNSVLAEEDSDLVVLQALECVANLVIAVPNDMSPHIEELVDSMFAGGLNDSLIKTLTVIRYG